MTTVPITITLNLPLETIERFLPHLIPNVKVEEKVKDEEKEENDISDIVKSYQINKIDEVINSLNLPEEANERIQKLKSDFVAGAPINMVEVVNLVTTYKSYLTGVDLNQLLNLFKNEEKKEEKVEDKKEAAPAFDLNQMLSTMGPMLNQLTNNNNNRRGRRRH